MRVDLAIVFMYFFIYLYRFYAYNREFLYLEVPYPTCERFLSYKQYDCSFSFFKSVFNVLNYWRSMYMYIRVHICTSILERCLYDVEIENYKNVQKLWILTVFCYEINRMRQILVTIQCTQWNSSSDL